MSNRTFVRLMLSIPVTFGLLVGGCINAAGAADSMRCTRTEVLVTAKDGTQHISVKTVCTEVAK